MGSADDIKAHRGTYGSFVALLKYAVPSIAAIAFIVILLISG